MVRSNVTVLNFPKKARTRVSDFYEQEWTVYNKPAMTELARDRDLTGETYRVLMTMWASMEEGNHIKLRPVDVAEHLGIRPSAVTRQAKILLGKGVLLPRRLYGWRLDPYYGFKGDPDRWLRREPGGKLVLVD